MFPGLKNAIKGHARKNMVTIEDLADGTILDEAEEEAEDEADDEELVEEEEECEEDELLLKHQLIVNFTNYYKDQE